MCCKKNHYNIYKLYSQRHLTIVQWYFLSIMFDILNGLENLVLFGALWYSLRNDFGGLVENWKMQLIFLGKFLAIENSIHARFIDYWFWFFSSWFMYKINFWEHNSKEDNPSPRCGKRRHLVLLLVRCISVKSTLTFTY